MDDIYVYYQKLPEGINEMVTPCFNGYTVYLDESCLFNRAKMERCYNHAVRHIRNRDFEKYNVAEIENER